MPRPVQSQGPQTIARLLDCVPVGELASYCLLCVQAIAPGREKVKVPSERESIVVCGVTPVLGVEMGRFQGLSSQPGEPKEQVQSSLRYTVSKRWRRDRGRHPEVNLRSSHVPEWVNAHTRVPCTCVHPHTLYKLVLLEV